MAPTNDFLPFCPTDTGSNLLSEADYTAAADRTSGNKPGIASAKLNNKALRQATYITSQVAQFIAAQSVTNVLDDAIPAKLLAQLTAVLAPFAPNLSKFTTGTGTFNSTFIFAIASGSATIGATYTNSAITYTVAATIASGTLLRASGNGAPTASGTLTKTGGTGDSTITFYAVRAPLYLAVKLVGGGGGGGGSAGGSANAAMGAAGAASLFGTTLLSAGGGGQGGSPGGASAAGGLGGTSSLGSGPVGIAIAGGSGAGVSGQNATPSAGGSGGGSALGGGAGGNSISSTVGIAAPANTGGGGSGATGPLNGYTGAGGGAGGYIDAVIFSPLNTYAYTVGAGGVGGLAGTSGGIGGAGGSGLVEVIEHYQ